MASPTLSLIQDLLNRYAMPVCMILGNIGNVFVFRKHHQNACSMYLLAASVMNIFFLTFIISFSMYIYERGDPAAQSPVFCKLRMYLPLVWGQMGRYFIVLAIMDPFAVTSVNAGLRALSQLSVARWLLAAFGGIWHVLGVHTLVMTTLQNGQCGQFSIYFVWYNVYSIATIDIVPLALTSIVGCLAYFNMKRLHTRIGSAGNGRDSNHANTGLHRRDRQLLKMVVAEVFVHFVTNILYPVIITEVAATSYMNADKSSSRIQIENFLVLIGRILFYTSNAASFYIFCAVSRSFRQEFKAIVYQCCHRVTGCLNMANT